MLVRAAFQTPHPTKKPDGTDGTDGTDKNGKTTPISANFFEKTPVSGVFLAFSAQFSSKTGTFSHFFPIFPPLSSFSAPPHPTGAGIHSWFKSSLLSRYSHLSLPLRALCVTFPIALSPKFAFICVHLQFFFSFSRFSPSFLRFSPNFRDFPHNFPPFFAKPGGGAYVWRAIGCRGRFGAVFRQWRWEKQWRGPAARVVKEGVSCDFFFWRLWRGG